MAEEEHEGIELALLRWQLKFRKNAGMPHDLTKASPEELGRYEALLRAAQLGDKEARAELSPPRRTRRAVESLAGVRD